MSRGCRVAFDAVGLPHTRHRKSPAISNISFRRHPLVTAPSGQRRHGTRRGIRLYLITAGR
jgi:hypothetical protein